LEIGYNFVNGSPLKNAITLTMALKPQIRPFQKRDQKVARQIILSGLGEHFGFIDETRNPDLDDIKTSYLRKGNIFAVALMMRKVVGTGGLIVDGEIGHIVRVSVEKQYRRNRIGKQIVNYLLIQARQRKIKCVVTKTEHSWSEVVAFYRVLGFIEYKRDTIDVYMKMNI